MCQRPWGRGGGRRAQDDSRGKGIEGGSVPNLNHCTWKCSPTSCRAGRPPVTPSVGREGARQKQKLTPPPGRRSGRGGCKQGRWSRSGRPQKVTSRRTGGPGTGTGTRPARARARLRRPGRGGRGGRPSRPGSIPAGKGCRVTPGAGPGRAGPGRGQGSR